MTFVNSIRISPPAVKTERKGLESMRKMTITAPSAQRRSLRALNWGGTLLVKGVGEIVVVGLGHNGGGKGRSEDGGVFRDEERGGRGMKRKKTKRGWEWER